MVKGDALMPVMDETAFVVAQLLKELMISSSSSSMLGSVNKAASAAGGGERGRRGCCVARPSNDAVPGGSDSASTAPTPVPD